MCQGSPEIWSGATPKNCGTIGHNAMKITHGSNVINYLHA
jgi:hypothetical protein